MLDLRANSSGGSTTLATIGTIMLGGDGQTVAGTPIVPTASIARLISYFVATTIADTLREVKMFSPDQLDQQNGEDYIPGASSLLGYYYKPTNLRYHSGAITVQARQNTAGANNMVGFQWLYRGLPPQYRSFLPPTRGSRYMAGQITPSTTFASALTAITWGQQAFAPSTPIPNGKYAILGAKVNALTNYALLRFIHASFGQFKPGFPVIDSTNTAIANAVAIKEDFFSNEGFQFVYLGQQLGIPLCPVFEVGTQGTGLTFEMASITADTPIVTVFLARVP